MKRARKQEMIRPTDEQLARARYQPEQLTERGQVVGMAYRRVPYYVTLAANGTITDDHAIAIAYYRNQDATARIGNTRCSLNQQRGGGNEWQSEHLHIARDMLAGIEEQIPPDLLDLLRAVAIDDRDFSDMARQAFAVQHDASPSGHQRRVIEKRFRLACDYLHGACAPWIRSA